MKLAEIKTEIEKYGFNIFDYDPDQLWQLQYAIEQNLCIAKFVNPAFNAGQMKEICIGKERGLDIELYAHRYFNKYQMREMRLALEYGIDFKDFSDPKISHSMMESIRIILHELKRLGGEIKYLNSINK